MKNDKLLLIPTKSLYVANRKSYWTPTACALIMQAMPRSPPSPHDEEDEEVERISKNYSPAVLLPSRRCTIRRGGS